MHTVNHSIDIRSKKTELILMLPAKGKKNVLEFERYFIPGRGPGKNFQKYTNESSFQVIWGRGWGEAGRGDKNQMRETANTP